MGETGRLTGYWSTDPARTVALLRDIIAALEWQYGGGLWPQELIVYEADVDDSGEADCHRLGGYVDRYDKGEVFVTIPPKDFRTWEWSRFLECFGGITPK